VKAGLAWRQLTVAHETLRIWRSAGRAGRYRTLGSGSGRNGCRVVDGPAAGCPSVAAVAVSPSLAAVVGVRSAGPCELPVFGRPRPVSTHPDSRSPQAASTWPPAQPDEQIRHGRSSRRAATAAVGPPSCRSRRPRPMSGWLQNQTPRRLGCPLLPPEPRSVSRRSVSGRLLSGRLLSVTDTAAARGGPPLQEAVACPASAGQMLPPPGGMGELPAEPVAKLGANQGHGRSLHRLGVLGGQPA
jgi:hypothetical protein